VKEAEMRDRRSLCIALAWMAVQLLGGGAIPTMARAQTANINVTDPKQDGTVTVTIKCQRANGTVQEIFASAAIEDTDDAEAKAAAIRTAINNQQSDCMNATSDGGTDSADITLTPEEGCKIISMTTNDDGTRESLGHKVESPEDVSADAGLEGTGEGGTALLALDGSSAEVSSTGKPALQIMQELVLDLSGQGVDVSFDGVRIRFGGNVANQMVRIGVDDPALRMSLHVGVTTLVPAMSPFATSVLVASLLGVALLRHRLIRSARRGAAAV
jgi:hypothetical protein